MSGLKELDESLLTLIFSKLECREVVRTMSLVCKKWKRVALYANHVRLPPSVFEIFKDRGINPLFRYDRVYQRGLLTETDSVLKGVHFQNTYGSVLNSWFVSKHGGIFTPWDYFIAGSRNSDSELKRHTTIRLETKGSFIQLTQIVNMIHFLGDAMLSTEAAVAFLDICPAMKFFCHVTLMDKESEREPSADKNAELSVTLALDDGTPVLAPYQNSALDIYTRGALFSKTIDGDVEENYEKPYFELCDTIAGYPRGVRRLIVSLTFKRGTFVPKRVSLEFQKA